MKEPRILLVNPPLVGGVAFTRQGRCQEREEVLGTTKPPYSLLVIAALLRDKGVKLRLVDLTAEERTTESLIDELKQSGFVPSLVLFPSTTPTLAADVAEMAKLKAAFGAALVSFGPHASTVPLESMARAPQVDAMLVGEPEDTAVALATRPDLSDLTGVPGVVWRRPDGSIAPAIGHGAFAGFKQMPRPAWDLLPLANYRLPMVSEAYVIVETSRGCPYACDFCVAPIHQGHKFRERDPKALGDEIEWARRELGVRYHADLRFRSEYDYALFEYYRSGKSFAFLDAAGACLHGRVLDAGCGGGGMHLSFAEEADEWWPSNSSPAFARPVRALPASAG